MIGLNRNVVTIFLRVQRGIVFQALQSALTYEVIGVVEILIHLLINGCSVKLLIDNLNSSCMRPRTCGRGSHLKLLGIVIEELPGHSLSDELPATVYIGCIWRGSPLVPQTLEEGNTVRLPEFRKRVQSFAKISFRYESGCRREWICLLIAATEDTNDEQGDDDAEADDDEDPGPQGKRQTWVLASAQGALVITREGTEGAQSALDVFVAGVPQCLGSCLADTFVSAEALTAAASSVLALRVGFTLVEAVGNIGTLLLLSTAASRLALKIIVAIIIVDLLTR